VGYFVVSQIAIHNMNALIDIAVSLALLVFLVVGVAVTGKILTNAASILSPLRRRRSVAGAAKQVRNKSARRVSVRGFEAGTRTFGGILIYHPDVRVIHGHSLTSK
jgi:hypothetical protein